ncbi:MAG: SDR family NAD(P)-dependent oxidoreductase [Nitriliruptorales bacterium]|nr:SDR family NAD(P)-dependent oxidoreductase [Nitriliruptorales bacterium]
MDLDGRTALITGGASGLGHATARALASAGANVVLVDLPDSEGEARADELGPGALFAAADVTDADAVTAALDAAVEAFGDLHVAVNCAGVGWPGRVVGREGPHDLDVFRKVVEINLVGTFNVLRLAAARMIDQPETENDDERGVIVNTASIAAFDGQVGQAAYAASKGGVVGMTLPIARDLAQHRIRVVTIAPGTFDTPMLAGLPQEARDKLAADIPHPHRLGDPDEFGLLARQLVEHPYLNGEVIRLDGALRMPPR